MPNLIATPRVFDKKVVVLKKDVTYGTDPVPTGAANWFEARNVTLTSYDVETADRNIIENWLGHSGKIVASKWSKLSFEVALAGAGAAGTAPKWGPMVLACAFAETVSAGVSAAYNLVSSAFSSATAYMELDGVLYKFVGCRGNMKGRITAKGIPVLMVELTSVYTAPTDAAISGIVKTGWTYEDAVNSVNTGKATLNAVDLAFSSFEWDLGNQLARINLPGPQVEVMIRDRAPTASLTVLAPTLAAFNPYALADAGTTVDLTNTHGTVAGKKVKTDAKVRVVGCSETEIEGMAAYNLSLDLIPVSGNDELTLTAL
jgi:hypothetical protein